MIEIYGSNGRLKCRVEPGSSSQQDKALQSDNVLSLSFTHYAFLELDVNDCCDFDGERYWLQEKYLPKQKSDREWEYNVRLYGIESLIKRFLVLNNTEGENEAVFTLTAPASEHVRLIVKAINDGMDHTTNWKVGEVLATENLTIDYEGTYCDEGLRKVAEAAGTEWWIEGETVNLCRCEYGEELMLRYGESLISLDRDKADGVKFYTRLFPIGSSRNIDRDKYGYTRLRLPGGAKFVDLPDLVSKYGVFHHFEQEAFSGIYPRRVGVVSNVRHEEATGTDGTPFMIYYFQDNDLSFDPNEYEIGGLVKHVAFQSGELDGRDFEVNYNSNSREFEIITTWPYDDDTQLPGGLLVPNIGDEYILWNIRMPDEYYGLAEMEFEAAVEAFNQQHRVDASVYKAPTNPRWVERTAAQLYVGRRVRLESEKYFPETGYRYSRITRVTRKVSDPFQVDLEISDAVSTSTMTKIEDSIHDVKVYAREAIGALPDIIKSWDTTRPTDTNLYSARRTHKEFLSKKNSDSAQGLIKFLAGLQTGDFRHGYQGARIDADGKAELDAATIRRAIQSLDFVRGQLGGAGWGIYDNQMGHSTMEVDNLIVRMKAIFAELEIRKLSYLGGDYIFSAAGSKIVKVQYIGHDSEDHEIVLNQTKLYTLTDGLGNFVMQGDEPVVWEKEEEIDPADIDAFRCFMYSDDGTTATMNWWEVDDQARCQTFNVKERGTINNASNRYYWRRVIGVGSKILEDGREYNYIDLSVTDCSLHDDPELEDDWPAPNDAVVQLGNRDSTNKANRQNAIEIIVEGDDAPAIIEYAGIYDYNLASHRRTKISPKGDEFVAKSFSYVTSNGTVPIPRDLGEWNENDTYYYYDRVSWNGALWLCMDASPDGIHGRGEDDDYVPSDGSEYWLKQVSGGQQGTPGQSAPTMVCVPNPVMVYTNKNKIAVGSWSTDIAVTAYYNGNKVNILSDPAMSVTKDGLWTADTPTVDGNGIGHVVIHGSSGVAVPNGTLRITAYIANPSGGNNIPVNGSVTVSPTMRGDDGESVPQVLMNPEVVWIPTNSQSYLSSNYSGTVNLNIVGAFGMFAQELESITFNGEEEYSIIRNQVKVVRVFLDGIVHEDMVIGVEWASSFMVQSLDIPLAITYTMQQGEESKVVHAVLSIRASKQGARGNDGENALSLQYSPSAMMFDLDSDYLALDDYHLSVEVRAYSGSERIATIDGLVDLYSNDGEIDGSLNYTIETETIGGNQYQYVIITANIFDGYTYDLPNPYVYFILLEGDNGNRINGGFPVMRNVSGAPGHNGRGISRMEVAYGVSSSAVQQPATWFPTVQPVSQGQYLWSRTTFHFTDLSQDQVLYSVMYQAADGENGTSVSIKGTAIGHTRNQSYAEQESEKGFWLIDENGGSPSVAAIINTAVSPSVVTIPDAGDGFIVESTGHLWVYSDSGWIDAGRIKGDDGRPSYIHYAWANSADGSKDFTTTKEIGENYLYMGVCADNNPEDPGNDYDIDQDYNEDDPEGHPWEFYEWNLIKGTDGNNGTKVRGNAITYLNTATAQVGYTFDKTGYFVIDLPNHTINSNGQFVNVGTGRGWGHKLLYFQKLTNTFSVEDAVEGDAYIVDGDLYSSVDFHWVNLGRYVGLDGENAYIHYAWADDVRVNDTTHVVTSVIGFTTTKFATEDKPWIGVRTDNEELDSQEPTDYQWTLVKGNGIAESKIFYAKSQDGTNPPNEGWTENLSSILPVAPLWYLWTKTVIRFTQGSQDSEQVSYSVAYSGREGRDGRSVVILGTWPTATTLPLPDGQGKIELTPGGEKTHTLEISEGFVVEENGHLYVWLGGETKWKDVGKFNGDDGQTSYLHIAWANKIVYDQYGMVTEVEDFTVEKQDGEDYIYMGVCSDFNEIDPDALPTDDDFLDVVNLYKWNKIKGAEGSNGTKIRCDIVAHAETLSNSITESGWYAVDNSASWIPTNSPNKLTDPTPCLRKRTAQGAWPKTEVDDDPTGAPNWRPFYEKEGVYYPDEGESFIDQDGVLWSYIEAKWVNLGQYVGDNAYLHLAWANSVKYDSQGNLTECEGFTTAKTTTQDYPYVGFCSDNNYNDPQTPSAYTWQRLRGMAQPMIVTDSDQVIADADADGKITSLNDVTGLPTTISLVVDGKTIGMGAWKTEQCKITMVYSDGTQVPINIVGNYPTQKPGIRLGQLTFGTSLTVAWTYAQDSGADPVLPLRQIRLHIVATDSDFNFTVDKTIPVIVNRKGNGSDFAVQYAQTKNGSWHDTFQDGDKWMRIYQNGAWGREIKIVASDMNVRGEAYFHFATVQGKPQEVGIGELCLVDLDGSTYSALVTFESQSSKTVVAALQGECYILRNDDDPKNGHLFIATDTGWQDIGQITGADGTNAVAIALNPASIILNQNDDGTLDSFTTQVIVVDGSTPTTDFTIGQPDTSRPQDWHTASAVVNNQTKVVTMTAANDPNGVPYDNGLVDIPVTYKGSTWLLRFNWYANLLGTWKETIIGDVNHAIAGLRIYAEDGSGNIIVTTRHGTYTLSASILSNVLEEYVSNADEDPEGHGIMSRSMVEQTARDIVATVEREVDGIQTDVSQLQMTAGQIQTTVSNLKTDVENLFCFAETHLTNGSYGVAGIVPFIQGYGVECKSVSNRITGFGLKGQGGSFVLTCEMRMQQQGIVTVSASLMNTNPVDGGNFNLNNTWEKKVFVFKDIPDSRTLTNNYDGYLDFTCQSITTSNRLYIRNLMLSRGDCKPNVFIVSSKDMMDNLPGDVLSFSKHENVQLQSDRYKGYPVYKLHFVNGETAQTDMLFANDVYLRQNQCYSLSFWAMSTKDCHIACFMHGTGDTVEGTITPTLVVSPTPTLASGEMSVGNAVDGVTYIRLTTGYKRYTVHWWTSSPNARSIILGRVQSSFTTQLTTDVYITGVEFREGYWTEDKLNSQSMIRQTATEIEMKVNETGINITDGTITLNANKTKIIGDLELHDEEQGLVIYDDDNVEQISVKSDSIGELSEDGFGVRIIGEGDAISYLQGGENKAVFEPISFGNVTQNEHVNISQILAIINTGYVTATPQYEYTVKCNGQTIATRNGTAIPAVYSSSYYYIPGCEGTASATGELTVSLILKCNAGVSFHTKIYLSTKKTGLNKIGSDGAVFANSREQYNWFGSDKTVIANNGTKVQVDNTSAIIQKGNSELKVDSTGIWKKQSNA